MGTVLNFLFPNNYQFIRLWCIIFVHDIYWQHEKIFTVSGRCKPVFVEQLKFDLCRAAAILLV